MYVKGEKIMKNKRGAKRLSLILALAVLFAVALSGFASADATHDHTDEYGLSSVSACAIAMDANGNPIMSACSDTSNLELLRKAAIGALEAQPEKNDNESTIMRRPICCIPNPPTRRVLLHYHLINNAGLCDLYDQYLTQCTNCGAILFEHQMIFVGSHIPGRHPTCPFVSA